ncbi:hypothetical protein EJ06DRAFT_532663 [Trichodelitschia bisporula]|uniref:Uncharacterized protein n=1 Tax=Trichodelitschia bisporula TaxID=703511 RepID=A0A6G1HNR1_9PEZI|nr:hypothetical protein EJ06DRAFT_532663 [Trichodelitschia bisporula]
MLSIKIIVLALGTVALAGPVPYNIAWRPAFCVAGYSGTGKTAVDTALGRSILHQGKSLGR